MAKENKKRRQQELQNAKNEARLKAADSQPVRQTEGEDDEGFDDELIGVPPPQQKERRINNPNPSAVDRIVGTPNDWEGSKEEKRIMAESDEDAYDDIYGGDDITYEQPTTSGLVVNNATPSVENTTNSVKVKHTTVSSTSASTKDAATSSTSNRPRVVTVTDPFDITDVPQAASAESIARFITGHLQQKPIRTTPARHAGVQPVRSTGMLLHGDRTYVGEILNDSDASDYYTWTIPGDGFNSKIELPRLGDLKNIRDWMQQLNEAVATIITAISHCKTRHPLGLMTESEVRLALIDVFDCHMLLKPNAKHMISQEYFDGIDLQHVSSTEIYSALIKNAEDVNREISKEGILKQLCQLRMQLTTHSSALNGMNVSSNFNQLWMEFSAILSKYPSAGFENSSALTHTLLSLVEPPTLRRYLIKYLYESIKKGTTIPMYLLPPQILTLENPRAVYKCLLKHLKEVIDPQMLITNGYLEVLKVDGFNIPNYPQEYINMDKSPHLTQQNDKKRSSSTVVSPTNSDHFNKRSRHGGPSNKDTVTSSNAVTKETKSSSNTTAKTGKHGQRIDQKKEKGDTLPRKGTTSKNVPSGQIKKPANQCCLCNQMGHKAYLCPIMPSCTCGKPHGKKHDPFRCDKGPLTHAGMEVLKTMKPKK